MRDKKSPVVVCKRVSSWFGGTAKTTNDSKVAVKTGTTAEIKKYCQSRSRTMTMMTLTISRSLPKAFSPATAGTSGAGSRGALAWAT